MTPRQDLPGHLPMRAPDLQGFGGRGWKTFPDFYITGWLLELPEKHNIWDTFIFTISGYDHHVLSIAAMHPDTDRELFLRQPRPTQESLGRKFSVILRPPLFTATLDAPSFGESIDRAKVGLNLMIRGDLSPFDEQQWKDLYA